MKIRDIIIAAASAATAAIVADYTYSYIHFSAHNQSPLNIATPDGTDQPYHPSVVFADEGWNGSRYWMAETPYPLGKNGDWKGLPPYRARWENPCIHSSDDGVHWSEPEGLQNPIDDLTDAEIANRDFFSDTELLLRDDTLECWYRISRFDDAGREHVTVFRKRSADGIRWGECETMIDQADSTVTAMLGDMVISPAISIGDDGKRYRMWYVDRVGEEGRGIRYSESADGRTWSPSRKLTLSRLDNAIWHIDVLPYGDKYYMIGYDWGNDLTLWTSDDGIDFCFTKELLRPNGISGSFYADGLYRSSLIRDHEGFKLYFSASGKKTSIGLMSGPSPEELTIVSVDGKNRIGFFGYAKHYLHKRIHSLKALLCFESELSSARYSVK